MATPLKVNHFGTQVVPMSASCQWMTVNSAPNTTNDPGDASGFSALTVFSRGNGFGTNLRVRLLYDVNATTMTTQPKYRLFGRDSTNNADNEWHPLPNKNGGYESTFAAVPSTDYSTGSYLIAEGDPLNFTHDCDGCDEFVLFVTQAMNHDVAGDGGVIQVKII